MIKINVALIICLLAMGTISGSAKAETNDAAIDKLAKKSWFSGAENCSLDKNPAIEVYQFNQDTYILRQNKCVHYEAPFIYLLFGEEHALLVDTGATAEQDKFPLAAKVSEIMSKRLKQLGVKEASIPLVVAHSHSHGDHVAADNQFKHFKDVEIIKIKDTKALISSFSFKNWPLKNAEIDLGKRVVTIIPTPGHQEQAITFYDHQTALLLTGDSIYPGRLYVRQWQDYQQSIQRIVDFTNTHEVSAILGAHIEMSTSQNVDYPVKSTYHPEEASLVLTVEDLTKLNSQLHELGDTAVRANLGNMIIYPVK
jgi:glyoxylase-like metal-dependent hydrolase (beta-lactamase superfamily II)